MMFLRTAARTLGAACLLLPIVAITPVQAQTQTKLYASPAYGRPGDEFYLAGGGFPPNQALTVTMYCKDWMYNAFGRWNWTIPVGKDGTFVRFKAIVQPPLLVKDVTCVIRPHVGDNAFGPGIPFHILDPNAPDPRRINVKVITQTIQDHTGSAEVIEIRSAPGADTKVLLRVTGAKVQNYSVRLPWTGHRTLRVPLPDAAHGSRAQVQVSAQLGDLVGKRVFWVGLRSHAVVHH